MYCEVRIPTYKRPELLARALTSLITQTHEQWYALIFDDSPEQEAKKVVDGFCDSRIIYQPHPKNLGRSKNIDYCFQSKAYRCGSYAFVLEDDNHLFPHFIKSNIDAIRANDVGILLRNQEIRIEKGSASVPTGATTRGKWFREGAHEPLELYARLFFCEGISNGGLFWDTQKIVSNLQVGTQVEDAWHQELFRTLQIEEPIWFEDVPMCVFTEFETKSKLINFAPKHNRGTQAILIHLIAKYKQEIVRLAEKISIDSGEEAMLERKLLNALYTNYSFKQTGKITASRVFLKSFVRYLLYRNPFSQVLSS